MSRDWVERAVAQGYGHLVIRDKVIEECARAAERELIYISDTTPVYTVTAIIAAAIRSLKEQK